MRLNAVFIVTVEIFVLETVVCQSVRRFQPKAAIGKVTQIEVTNVFRVVMLKVDGFSSMFVSVDGFSGSPTVVGIKVPLGEALCMDVSPCFNQNFRTLVVSNAETEKKHILASVKHAVGLDMLGKIVEEVSSDIVVVLEDRNLKRGETKFVGYVVVDVVSSEEFDHIKKA